MELCKLLKITVFQAENLDIYEKEFIKNIDINKSKINDFEKNQIELKEKIKVYKQEIKVIKLHINKLENNIVQEQKKVKNIMKLFVFFLEEKNLNLLRNTF